MMFGRRSDPRRTIEDLVRQQLVWDFGDVRFDLRTPDLNPSEWDWPAFLTSAAPGHPGFHIAGDTESTVTWLSGLSAGQVERDAIAYAERRGVIVLRPGDVVRAQGAEIVRNTDDPLAHPADSEAVVLNLVVDGPNGSRPGGSMYLRRKGRLADDPTSDRFTMSALAARLPTAAPAEAVQRVLELRSEVELRQNALESMLQAAGKGATGADATLSEWHAIWRVLGLDEIVNLAARYGYEQGRLEAASAMEALARKSIDRTDQARDAGRKRAIPTRKEFAQEYWKQQPTATKYAVAKAYLAEGYEPGADQGSVERSMGRFAPSTSPSYRGA